MIFQGDISIEFNEQSGGTRRVLTDSILHRMDEWVVISHKGKLISFPARNVFSVAFKDEEDD